MVRIAKNQSVNGLSRIVLLCNCFLLIFLGIATLFKEQAYSATFVEFLLNRMAGTALVFGGILTLLPKEILKFNKVIHFMVVPFVGLLYLNWTKFVSVGYLPEQLIEHALQLALPVLAIWTLSNYSKKHLLLSLKVLIALTFVGHALFALGWHGVPKHFIGMTQNILNLDHNNSLLFLRVFGFLDVVAAVLIFIPRLRNAGLIYMIVWGALTAFARPLSSAVEGLSADFFLSGIPGAVMRFPHFIIPLALYYVATNKSLVNLGLQWPRSWSPNS